MSTALNRLSFYFLLIYIGFLFLMAPKNIRDFLSKWLGIHPLEVLFYCNLLILLIGVIGFFGIVDWKAAFRSIFTVGLSLVVAAFLTYLLFVGNLEAL